MTDEQARADASAESSQNQVSPGQMLREGRERHNLTLEQVAERLHLRQQVVSDLEQDQYSKYVSSTFTRGYLRAYARLVEVDDEAVLAAYSTLGLVDKPQQMKSFSRRTRQQSNDNKLMLVTYIVGALIIGSAVVFWLQNSRDTNGDVATPNNPGNVAQRLVDEQNEHVDIEQPVSSQDNVSQAREPIFVNPNNELGSDSASQTGENSLASTQDVAAHDEAQGEIAGEGEESAAQDTTDQDAADQDAADQDTTDQETTDQDLAEQVDGSDASDGALEQAETGLPDEPLVLTFSGDAWIRIVDATGEPIAFGVKPDGHVSALDGQPPYDIAIGAPENVALYYEGEAIDLSSYRPGRLARITIPQPE